MSSDCQTLRAAEDQYRSLPTEFRLSHTCLSWSLALLNSSVRITLQDLPDVLLALDGNIQLPEQLRDDVEAVQVEGGPAALEQELQHLQELRKENGKIIQLLTCPAFSCFPSDGEKILNLSFLVSDRMVRLS
jgi:hypothetical protein